MDITSAVQAEVLVDESILKHSDHAFVVLSEKTFERPFGWVVYYTTDKYLKSGNPRDLVPGVAPVIVTRDGKLSKLPSSVPPSMSIARFELDWNARIKK